ncbi:hypothetical protein NKH84_04495 [Mesorhizobium sp. M0902]|uniref:hypothetical protein n=1 Tax=unclassified Mesorhizobium TaxID=325217 RepID=UPI00333A5DB0
MTVAWLAIALGFAMEALILTVRFAAGAYPATTQVLIELAQGVTWSFFVCAGVSLGTALTKVRARSNTGCSAGHLRRWHRRKNRVRSISRWQAP